VKTYIDYKFLGVHSFIETLDKTGTDYRLFDDDFSVIYRNNPEVAGPEDIIRTGLITRNEQGAFFTEFGIKLTENYYSYIVFIFDHHPAIDELKFIAFELEGIINENLNNIDISMFAEKLSGK